MSENKRRLEKDVNFVSNFMRKYLRERNVREDRIPNYSE